MVYVRISLVACMTRLLTESCLLRQPGDYALAISLVASGRIKLAELVTHRYAFEEAEKAFAAARAGSGADGKPVIKVLM